MSLRLHQKDPEMFGSLDGEICGCKTGFVVFVERTIFEGVSKPTIIDENDIFLVFLVLYNEHIAQLLF